MPKHDCMKMSALLNTDKNSKKEKDVTDQSEGIEADAIISHIKDLPTALINLV